MSVDRDSDRDHAAEYDVAQLRPRAAIDRAGRQMQQQVDDARGVVATEQPAIELLLLWADADKAGYRREQRIEQARPHTLSGCTAMMLIRSGRRINAIIDARR
jgi:hypothetical protein